MYENMYLTGSPLADAQGNSDALWNKHWRMYADQGDKQHLHVRLLLVLHGAFLF